MADAHLCPICGAELPAGSWSEVCPRCATQAATDLGAPRATDAIAEPESTPADATSDWAEMPRGSTTAAGNVNGREAASASLPLGATVRYFGDYEIRRELGRGGMGVVYEARQVSLNRPVALKMVRAGLLAGDDELRRFQNEAEAVALPDHGGVVPVYEVGEHDGQHYFSMKLVEGGSLVPLLERYQADPRAAARLVAEAAEAVAHAHARGILHRDLKPANILVDAAGHPHVTDFGLAKRVEVDVGLTASGALLGTPAYMAPEQAEGRRGSITTATDVYGLGAVFYALLTGRAPFAGGSVVETLDAVRNAPPEPPTRLNGRVPLDLETICLKCLEKDPRRRYATAQALADDLRAWLDNRPIAARRVGAAERAWLWCKRRPVPAGLASALLLAVLGGAAVSTVLWIRAERNYREARERLDLALEAIRTFHSGVAADVILQRPELEGLRKKLLGSAAEFYNRLRLQLERSGTADTGSRFLLGDATVHLAELSNQVGSKDTSLELYREAIALADDLVHDEPSSTRHRLNRGKTCTDLGNLLYDAGRFDEAEATCLQALRDFQEVLRLDPNNSPARMQLYAITNNLGRLASSRGELERALELFAQAASGQERFAADFPDHLANRRDLGISLNNCGIMLARLGRHAEARAMQERAVEVLSDARPITSRTIRDDSTLIGALTDLGHTYRALGAPAEALRAYGRARDIAAARLQASPNADRPRFDLATSLVNCLVAQAELGREPDADAFLEPVAILRELVDEHPNILYYRNSLATSTHDFAMACEEEGRFVEAMDAYRSASEHLTELARQAPRDPRPSMLLFGNATDLGRCALKAGQAAEALDALTDGRRWSASVISEGNPVNLYNFACNLALSALAAAQLGPSHEAEVHRLSEDAMIALRRAVEAGFAPAEHIARDADLEILRDRPDFRRLLAELFDRIFPVMPWAR